MAPTAFDVAFARLKSSFDYVAGGKAKESPRCASKVAGNLGSPRSWAFQAHKRGLSALFLALFSLIFLSKSFKGSLAHGSHAIYFRPTFTDLSGDKATTVEEVTQPQPAKAILYPIEVLPRGQDACAHSSSIPKIALMFLTRGTLFHSATWREWIRSAEGLLPAEALCAQGKQESIAAACGDNSTKVSLEDNFISRQYLFNVYIHAPPNVNSESKLAKIYHNLAFLMHLNSTMTIFFTPKYVYYLGAGSELGAPWSSYLIRHRIFPEWGGPSLMAATRNLLWEAFRDPLNQRFVLLSESDVPLWHPLIFYRQLLGEQSSRSNAWRRQPWEMDVQRWTWKMAISAGGMRRSLWRKSSQWFVLIRKHAEVVLRDESVFRTFEEHCKSGWDDSYNRWRDCYTDEHYIPTLLAIHGLTNETFPKVFGAAFADWSAGEPHPKEYSHAEEVTVDFFRDGMQRENGCNGSVVNREAIVRDVRGQFIRIEEMVARGEENNVTRENDEICRQVENLENLPLPGNGTCYVTARKFVLSTADAVLDNVFLKCDNGLALLDRGVCERAASARAEERRWEKLAESAENF